MVEVVEVVEAEAEAAATATAATAATATAALERMLRRTSGISLMRIFHYFDARMHAELAPKMVRTGSSPHTDWHLITIVLQDEVGGLQVRSRDGTWLDVPANQGELVLIVGDYLQLLGGGRVRSPVHRVLLPGEGGSGSGLGLGLGSGFRFSWWPFSYWPFSWWPFSCLPFSSRRIPPIHGEHTDGRYSFTFFFYPEFNSTLSAELSSELARAWPPGAHGAADLEVNTLLPWSATREEYVAAAAALAQRPFGEAMLAKWRGVGANHVSTVGKSEL